ncbi:MAG: DUF4149 domain-containing protein [Bacteriovoracaceae bacterium]|nr:DUF4149 domain-containing protein [Bacteriovoracaceae bacterium]
MRQKILMTLISAWLATTMMVDFVAIPIVFRTLNDVMLAGSVGMKLFGIYNKIEWMLGLGFLLAALPFWKLAWRQRSFAIASLILFILINVYAFYITPSIIALTHSMREALSGDVSVIAAMSQRHQFFHTLYVRLDGFKILLLVYSLVFMFRYKKQGTL